MVTSKDLAGIAVTLNERAADIVMMLGEERSARSIRMSELRYVTVKLMNFLQTNNPNFSQERFVSILGPWYHTTQPQAGKETI